MSALPLRASTASTRLKHAQAAATTTTPGSDRCVHPPVPAPVHCHGPFTFSFRCSFVVVLRCLYPRQLQWYVLAATPRAKDVVLVIDTSGSMGQQTSFGPRMPRAIEAAQVVLSTLSPNDRVGVVDFDSNAEYPSVLNCGGSVPQLSSATPDAVDALVTWTQSLRAGGGTAYIDGLSLAFDMFDNTGDIGNDRVILFLSDGLPGEEPNAITSFLDTRRDTDSNFRLLTYGFGDSTLSECVFAHAVHSRWVAPDCVDVPGVSPALPAAPSLKTWRTKTTASSG